MLIVAYFVLNCHICVQLQHVSAIDRKPYYCTIDKYYNGAQMYMYQYTIYPQHEISFVPLLRNLTLAVNKKESNLPISTTCCVVYE